MRLHRNVSSRLDVDLVKLRLAPGTLRHGVQVHQDGGDLTRTESIAGGPFGWLVAGLDTWFHFGTSQNDGTPSSVTPLIQPALIIWQLVVQLCCPEAKLLTHTNTSASASASASINKQTNKPTNKQASKQTNKQTNARTQTLTQGRLVPMTL